jgi:hypothetical protein
MKTYSEKLRDPRWQRKRLEIMQRDNFTCTQCGDTKSTLNIHHWEYRKEPWDVSSEDLTTVCEACHKEIENCKAMTKDRMKNKDFRRKIIDSESESCTWYSSLDFLPLADGDEKFFGYVVGMGVFVADWDPDFMYSFVDFQYGDEINRYVLPNNAQLIEDLHSELLDNMNNGSSGHGIYGKVWIKFNGSKYCVFNP